MRCTPKLVTASCRSNSFRSFFVSSWKVSISRGVDVAVILLLMVSGCLTGVMEVVFALVMLK